ncbi:CLUMA_CG008852, isoform A [Clunio marinus]|uniref:CLUMA_CG008852, isoform A n=1 Tax=Clunio marinus TaxID=568069 RepID=A0A1J1I8C5_9DIPT|nr:CLUMA_CG008852, isoform A [Clunio marinus]
MKLIRILKAFTCQLEKKKLFLTSCEDLLRLTMRIQHSELFYLNKSALTLSTDSSKNNCEKNEEKERQMQQMVSDEKRKHDSIANNVITYLTESTRGSVLNGTVRKSCGKVETTKYCNIEFN